MHMIMGRGARRVLAAVAALAVTGSAHAAIVIGTINPGSTPYAGPTPTYDFNSPAGTPSLTGGSVVSGTTGNHAQPVGSTGGYYAVGPSDGNPGTINLSGWGDIFNISLIWGSVDTYNTLEFLDGSNNILASFVGNNIWIPANGNQSDPHTNPVVTFLLDGADVAAFSSLRLTSTTNAFEIDNLAINSPTPGTNSAVPEPATWAMMLLGFGAAGFSMRRRRSMVLAPAT